jgi:outer membrane lipoprotein-sorting protein
MKSKIVNIIIFIFFITSYAYSMTGEEAMLKLNERLNSAGTLSGKISFSYQSGQTFSGIFMYMKPGKIYVKFTEPPGKVIVTNGRRLWVYDSLTDVCGVQEIDTEEVSTEAEPDNKDAKSGTETRAKLRGGIFFLYKSYTSKLISDDSSQHTVELTNDNRMYSNIKIVLNSDFMLNSASFSDKNGGGFVIKLSDVKAGEKIAPGLFNFNVPAEAQVIKNPLDVR